MALSDQDEEIREDDKNRLFETQQREGKSARDHAKFLIPIVIVVIVIIAGIVYLLLPGVGQKVRPDNDLYDAVYDHMVTSKKRTVSNMDFYYCGDFYTVDITVEPKPVAPTKPEDAATEFKAAARKTADGTWQVSSTAIRSKEEFTGCRE